MSNIFNSSIGKKLMMALAGLFLATFLLVHLGINLTLIIFEDPRIFNIAAHFMASNILIKIFEIVLFGGILLHIIYGLIVQVLNWIARPIVYKVSNPAQTSFFSRFMIHTALIILVFLVIHLFDFYFKAKFGHGHVAEITYNGKLYHDLGTMVIEKFQILWVVISYIAFFLFLGFHLLRGFGSAFQTLGLNHKLYTPVIKSLGYIYTFIVVAGFIVIPLWIYLTR
ncbi:MAG: succinate dehydrogenase cytochrome b subunit [Bacteroidales bacterium]|nr:succinate dehydrogenase cytochrome b subunit [Bacteroidales bacterium]